MQGPWEKMRGRGGGAESEVKHGMPLTNLPLANVPQGMRGWSRRGGVGVLSEARQPIYRKVCAVGGNRRGGRSAHCAQSTKAPHATH
jgi:hypothetical protein